MSHNPEAVIDCPNCGYKAQYNYCSRCGQATHLHKDTFWGLIVHFVAHYFHYDSKFWNTIKMLWIKPGALTIAYRNKQRMRFIDPISLYIFVSAVFFLCFFTVTDGFIKNKDFGGSKNNAGVKSEQYEDTKSERAKKEEIENETEFDRRISSGVRKASENKEILKETAKMLIHNIPKGVFFMIPIMAFMLKLLFVRRKEAYFVDHGIFALHYHSFWFSLMLLMFINPFSDFTSTLSGILMLGGAVYFVAALKRTYNIGILRSVFYSIIIGSIYSAFLLVVLLANVAYTLYLQG